MIDNISVVIIAKNAAKTIDTFFHFLNGYASLLISVSETNGVFYKYLKPYKENRKI